MRHGVLVPADSRMRGRITVEYKKTRISIDLKGIDKRITPDSATFSGIREMYCRDVYLKFFDLSKLKLLNVIDAGGNRGLFSTFAAAAGAKVAWVEPQPKYVDAISSLIGDNKTQGRVYPLRGILRGSQGLSQPGKEELTIDGSGASYSVEEIMAKCDMPSISFLKMDVEGAEFEVLLTSDNWIDQLENLAMEVHRSLGDPSELADHLLKNGFQVLTKDASLEPVDPSRADYLYASKTGALALG